MTQTNSTLKDKADLKKTTKMLNFLKLKINSFYLNNQKQQRQKEGLEIV